VWTYIRGTTRRVPFAHWGIPLPACKDLTKKKQVKKRVNKKKNKGKIKECKTLFIYWIQSNQISLDVLYLVFIPIRALLGVDIVPSLTRYGINYSISSISTGLVSLTDIGIDMLV